MDTGMIRRIDDLGRVVIPKEIRKSLRIKEGDPLEIFTNKEELVFKKYSPVVSLLSCAKIVADGITELTDKPCLITDTDEIIYVTGNKNQEFNGKKISTELENVLKDRRSLLADKSEGGKIIPIFSEEQSQTENQVVVPIINCGDCFGSLVLFDTDKENKFSHNEVKLVQLGAKFIAKQFEC